VPTPESEDQVPRFAHDFLEIAEITASGKDREASGRPSLTDLALWIWMCRLSCTFIAGLRHRTHGQPVQEELPNDEAPPIDEALQQAFMQILSQRLLDLATWKRLADGSSDLPECIEATKYEIRAVITGTAD